MAIPQVNLCTLSLKNSPWDYFLIPIETQNIQNSNLQILAHPTTHSAKNWSAFPDVTEHISASADQ